MSFEGYEYETNRASDKKYSFYDRGNKHVSVLNSVLLPAEQPGQPAPRRCPGFSSCVAGRRGGTGGREAPGSGLSCARTQQQHMRSPQPAQSEPTLRKN